MKTAVKYSVVDFSKEDFSLDLFTEIKPLIQKHYQEISLYQDILLEPNLPMYKVMDENKYARIYTARAQSKLVGYQLFCVGRHSHFDVLCAHQDSLYLTKEYRKGMIGYNFLKWCDEQLRQDGVKIIQQSVSINHDFSPLLCRLGYEPHDVLYVRRLK